MYSPRRSGVLFALAALAAIRAESQTLAINVAWLPIADAERAMKAPLVEKDAGVEAIFWRVHVIDEIQGQDLQRTLYHYVRLKVFNDKGKSQVATIDISLDEKTSIEYLAGRTVKADGTEVDLKKESIYERDLVRASGRKSRVKSFAMPAVEAGAIVEYRWREVHVNPGSLYNRLQFQREYPIQKVTYFIRPIPHEYTGGAVMHIMAFHCAPSPWKLEPNGLQSTTVENLPAFHEEPMMPGEPNIRQWALLYYRDSTKRDPDKYWNTTGKDLYSNLLKPAMHVNDDIKQAAHRAVEGISGDELKMIALIRYIRQNVRDLYGDQVTDDERNRIVKSLPKDHNRTSVEVSKSGIGSPDEMNTLLAAMASQAGLEARPAMVGDRDDLLFDPRMVEEYFLRSIDMAVNIGGKWKLYDVSARMLPASMVTWREEGMKALIGDPKTPFFVDSPVSEPAASRSVRTAKFNLSEDGLLEGDVALSYTGHEAYDRRIDLQGDSEARRPEILKERIVKTFPAAEVTGLKIEDFADGEKPLHIAYHIKISDYGQRTGKRLLFEPMFFQRGVVPLFAATERRYPVAFPFAWNESDSITIKLPAGFSLDNAENPNPMNFGKVGSYDLKLSLSKQHELVCHRELIFGAEGLIGFPIETYPRLKQGFDEIHTRDGVTISLKPDAPVVK